MSSSAARSTSVRGSARTSHLRAPVLTAAAVAAGLQAGTYVVFAVGVMPGLAHADDRTFVSTMQQVNTSIVNPLFLLTFVGAPLLTGVAILTSGSAARPWLVAATVLAAATFVVTAAGNVPLDDALAAAGPVDRVRDLAAVRADFEDPWVRLDLVRTATSIGALLALGVAMVRA